MPYITCPCSKRIKVFLSRLQRSKYCSKECQSRYRKRPSGLTYKTVKQNRGWFKKGFKPWNANQRIKIHCEWCGKELWRIPFKIKRSKHFFCSWKHNGLWKAENLRGEKIYNWKGGYEPYYGPNWLVQRRKALERDHYTCQKSGKTKSDLGKNPDVHHKIPFRIFGLKNYKKANRLSNLITLSSSYHSKIPN